MGRLLRVVEVVSLPVLHVIRNVRAASVSARVAVGGGISMVAEPRTSSDRGGMPGLSTARATPDRALIGLFVGASAAAGTAAWLASCSTCSPTTARRTS
jgi:hypothetical protein